MTGEEGQEMLNIQSKFWSMFDERLADRSRLFTEYRDHLRQTRREMSNARSTRTKILLEEIESL